MKKRKNSIKQIITKKFKLIEGNWNIKYNQILKILPVPHRWIITAKKKQLTLLTAAAERWFIQKSKTNKQTNTAEVANVTCMILKLELFNPWTTPSCRLKAM